MSGTDDLLRMIGIGTIGVIGIGIVLFILTAMCVVVGIFAVATLPPGTPAATIGPYDYYPDNGQIDVTPYPGVNETHEATIFDESKTIPAGRFQYYSLVMQPGTAVHVRVSTDGLPVDVLVLDSGGYGEYVNDVNAGNASGLDPIVSNYYLAGKDLTFTSHATDRYYVVIDNTALPAGGADGEFDVTVHTTITPA